jgi:hypothetical protein
MIDAELFGAICGGGFFSLSRSRIRLARDERCGGAPSVTAQRQCGGASLRSIVQFPPVCRARRLLLRAARSKSASHARKQAAIFVDFCALTRMPRDFATILHFFARSSTMLLSRHARFVAVLSC